MNKIPLSIAHRIIEPGPVVLLTTIQEGRPNIMTMSWHTMLRFNPPLIGCMVGVWNHSFKTLKTTKECVLAVPTLQLAHKVVEVGNCSGHTVHKFEAFGLTPLPAEEVGAPLIAECLANLECKLVDASMVKKYNFFILEVVKAWVDPKKKERRIIRHNGDGTFVTDGKTINLKEKMSKWQALTR